MSKLKTIFSLVLIFCVLRCECAQVDFEDVDIEAGKSALKKIQDGIQKLKDNTILKNVVTAGKVLGHTAAAIKSIVDLIKGPEESKELKFMKKEFKKINEKLDVLEYEFTDIKNQIDWTTMKVNVGQYERTIKALELTHAAYMKAPRVIAEIFGQRFIQGYERQYLDAALKLYNALASDGIFQENIVAVARRQFEEYQAKIAHFVSYILLIIERGVILESTYHSLKGDAKAESRAKSEWESRFKKLEVVAANFDTEIRNAWSNQYKFDCTKIVKTKSDLSEKQMSEHLFKFLTKKYPWRHWFVLVYPFEHNGRVRWFKHCNGWNSGNVGNKIITVTSLLPNRKGQKSDPKIFNRNFRTTAYGSREQIAKILFDATPTTCEFFHFKGIFQNRNPLSVRTNIKVHSEKTTVYVNVAFVKVPVSYKILAIV